MNSAGNITTLDHIGMIIRDLNACEDIFKRLGFQVTPRSRLHKPDPATGNKVPSGTSNHHLTFHQGYVEIASVTDPSGGNMLLEYLDRYEGIHILAFGTGSADDARAQIEDTGISVAAPETWGREIHFGRKGVASVKWFVIPEDLAHEGLVVVVEHLNPEMIRSPEILDHPNGALALKELICCVDNVSETCTRYQQILGIKDQAAGEARSFQLAEGRILFLDKKGLHSIYPGIRIPHVPCLFGFTAKVKDIRHAESCLTNNGVQHSKIQDGSFWVGPQETFGALLQFEQA
ncbi:VOC family protein [Thermodesulfobacteriota bacterium]